MIAPKLYGDRLALVAEDAKPYGVKLDDYTAVGRVIAAGPGRLNDHSARVDVPHKAGDAVIYSLKDAVQISFGESAFVVVGPEALICEAPPAREPEPETEPEPEAEPEADDAPPAETV